MVIGKWICCILMRPRELPCGLSLTTESVKSELKLMPDCSRNATSSGNSRGKHLVSVQVQNWHRGAISLNRQLDFSTRSTRAIWKANTNHFTDPGSPSHDLRDISKIANRW